MPALEAVFLHIPAALGCADLILNGVLERFPELRIGIVELSAMWVPLFLMMLDGAWAFTRQINGADPPTRCRCSRATTSAARCASRRSPTRCRPHHRSSSAAPIC